MHFRRSFYVKPFVSLLLPVLLAACSFGGIGYGIILWPDEDTPSKSASLVRLESESTIEGTYIVKDLESGEKYSITQWRVERYDDKKEAEQAAADYRPFADQMALSKEVGLPVRAQPDALSDRVYRLRKEEEMKVIAKASDEVQVGSYNGYWYKIVTRDGTVGYCFDHYLILYKAGEREQALAVRDADPRLEDFFSRPYYPERFQHLINQGTVELQTVRPEYGLFPDSENGTVIINSPKYHVEEEFSSIKEAGNNRYYFEDSSLYVTFEQQTPPLSSIVVQFKVDSTNITARYVSIPGLEDAIKAEQTRREEALTAMIEEGTKFVSNAYGSIEIQENGHFQWTGNERLIPSVLKSYFGNQGTIQFDRYLSGSLKNEYDGAATFRFAGAQPNEPVTFLYSLEPQGLKLTLVPEESVSDFVVQKIGYNSLVLFMSRQE